MQACLSILKDLAIEAIRPPLLSPERDGYDLTESIDLQSACSYCRDDTGIVDDLHLYVLLDCS